MQSLTLLFALFVAVPALAANHHHHHGRHHHGKHAAVKVASKVDTVAVQAAAMQKKPEEKVVAKAKADEPKADGPKAKADEAKGNLLVMGPLPADFSERFAQAVGHATDTDAAKIKVTKTAANKEEHNIFSVDFSADAKVVKAVEAQSVDPASKLATGNLHKFLVADDDAPARKSANAAVPVPQKSIDIDTAMPYGELEPFGREDTAQELTEGSVTESNEMVDQLERAEVAEEKRSVFRALTRLRGAAITSFDGVARSQTGNIDEYNKIHQWRKTHPLHHLADEESDVAKWAFPDNADF